MTNYSKLRQKTEDLYEQIGKPTMSNHFGAKRTNATSIEDVADGNLLTVIGDMKLYKQQLGLN